MSARRARHIAGHHFSIRDLGIGGAHVPPQMRGSYRATTTKLPSACSRHLNVWLAAMPCAHERVRIEKYALPYPLPGAVLTGGEDQPSPRS